MRVVTDERSGSLQFTLQNVRRKGDVALAAGAVLVAAVAWVGWESTGVAVLCLFGVILSMHRWLSPGSRVLSVTRRCLEGEGKTVAWRDVIDLTFRAGGEDEASGIYAKTGRLSVTCVLQIADANAAREILFAIERKFWDVPRAERPGPLWDSVKQALGDLQDAVTTLRR